MESTANFDPNEFIAKPNNWFSTPVIYDGYGQAEFRKPKGIVRGPTKVSYDEFGKFNIEMDVEKIETEKPLHFELQELLGGQKAIRHKDSISLSLGTTANDCTKLTVNNPNGVFTAKENIIFTYEYNIFGMSNCKIKFYPVRPLFQSNNNKLVKYWVLPLTNFVSRFSSKHPNLNRHILRIYPTPIVPTGLSEKEHIIATWNANTKNRLIVFAFNKKLGFIEPLPDYDQRRERLLAGKEHSLLTALMIGEVAGKSESLSNVNDWFPYDFLHLLGLASGTEVGALWVEFRDNEGKLVQRIHVKLGGSTFQKGIAALDEYVHSGTGLLLTRSAQSTVFRKSFVRVALNNIIKAGENGLPIEHKLGYLFFALDTLCTHFRLTKNQPLKQTLPDEKLRRLLEKVIKTASYEITMLSKEAKGDGKIEYIKVIQRIANQVKGAININTGFGKAVATLLRKFGQPDFSIVNAYYEKQHRLKFKTLEKELSRRRGAVMHQGFIEIRSSKREINNIIRLMNHLHDILFRIIFKLLGYNGTYQPPVIISSVKASVDWVKPNTSAKNLGYK